MKYKEMLMATVKDALEILGYSSSEKNEIIGLWYRAEINEDKGLVLTSQRYDIRRGTLLITNGLTIVQVFSKSRC